jgi:Permease MlaE
LPSVSARLAYCATRLLAAWIALPFLYLVSIGVMYLASYLSVVKQVADVSSGGYSLIFWMFQDPTDVMFSLIKGMAMATVIVLVGCYYGYTASGGPVGVGTAKSMAFNIVAVHILGMVGTVIFWGATRGRRSGASSTAFGEDRRDNREKAEREAKHHAVQRRFDFSDVAFDTVEPLFRFLPALSDSPVAFVEPSIDLRELLVDLRESLVDPIETPFEFAVRPLHDLHAARLADKVQLFVAETESFGTTLWRKWNF